MIVKANQEFRDPVHGLIKLTDQEVAIIDQLPFQRLRRIKQLAMAHLVYPGALHTRFDHSLGTLHTAGRILDQVADSAHLCYDDIRAVRLAALLHDIGHGPFSHVSEYLLNAHHKLPAPDIGAKEKIHEKLTVDIINNDPSIACLLTDADRESVTEIIKGSNRRDIKRDIVSSDLDADKVDYLSRDAHFTGVKYGIFDLEKVYESFVYMNQGQESFLGIREAGIFAIEQLILAKYHMTQQVYAHRVRVITDYMIVRGLELAIADGLSELQDLYEYDGSFAFSQRYIEYYDDRIIEVLIASDLIRPQSIYRRLHSRRLYKQLVRLPLTDRHEKNAVLLNRYINLSPESKCKLQDLIAEHLKCEAWEIIIEIKNIKNPAYQSRGALNPEAILIQDSSGNPTNMSTYDDDLVAAKLPSSDILYVIGPYEWTSSDDQLSISSERSSVQNDIMGIIADEVGGSK